MTQGLAVLAVAFRASAAGLLGLLELELATELLTSLEGAEKPTGSINGDSQELPNVNG